jgi:hypothetical protein
LAFEVAREMCEEEELGMEDSIERSWKRDLKPFYQGLEVVEMGTHSLGVEWAAKATAVDSEGREERYWLMTETVANSCLHWAKWKGWAERR